MTLTQMQYFATVCELRNISKAAKTLFISQPALSATLVELEKEVGFQLFERKSRGVSPTEEALILLSHVTAILKRYNLMMRELPHIMENQNTIRVGFRPFGGESQFFSLYKGFAKQYPNIHVHIHEMTTGTPSIYLDEGQIDVLFLPQRRMPEDSGKKYEMLYLGGETLGLYCHEDNPLAKKDVLQMEDLVGQPFVIWSGQEDFRERLEHAFSRINANMTIRAVIPQISGMLEFIKNDMAIGFLPGEHIEDIRGIKRLQMPLYNGNPMLPPVAEVYMLWKKETERFGNKKLFIDYVRERRTEEA